jgi:hypothetical protein
MRYIFAAAMLVLTGSLGYARLGETESELVHRFGQPTTRTSHSISAQGKVWALGPTLGFRQDGWAISCDLVDGKCVRVEYGKQGDWTEEQIQQVLTANSQDGKWIETTSPSIGTFGRTWKRTDGAICRWSTVFGMKLTHPAYEHTKESAEAKAKAEASRKPRI